MLADASLLVNASVLVGVALVIGWTGVRLSRLADQLSDRLGLGESIGGTFFLGAVTSLPEIAASVLAALEGRPALALGNAIGGIALQTTFLAAADIAHRKANLEHAAASVPNMIQTGVLIALLGLVLMGFSGPDVTVGHVHVISPLLVLAGMAGLWLAWKARRHPMWKPTKTDETVVDVPEEGQTSASLPRMLVEFGVIASVIAVAGGLAAHTSGNIADQTGMNEALAGALLTGVATSLPELVTTVAAVRRGALTLAVSDIVGGSLLDVLLVAIADLAFVGGSIFHARGVGADESFIAALAIVLNTVLLVGLLYRQRDGPGKIGFESVTIVALYLGGFAVLSLL
ncbi:hypothetical protein WG922_01440 [Ramlibacter sp. AN1015]|uniref:sodium:calcium antiporter n=1 Tax=Ramlibacter sp. AN1015 TaxID=3133428 RepID=UPI0030C4F4EE